MADEKEWTSLSGCIRTEQLSNEQKFILMTFRPNDRIFAKQMSDQEVIEKLTLGIFNIVSHQENPKNALREVIGALEVLEKQF